MEYKKIIKLVDDTPNQPTKFQAKHWVEIIFFFFCLGFLSRTFTIHGTAGEGGGYLFNSSLPLPPASQTLRH